MTRTRSAYRRSWRALGILGVASAVLLLIPLQASAADLRQGSTVSIGGDERVADDLYAAGGTITVDGTVTGSVLAAGGNITVNGNVGRDLMVGGGTITVNGRVGGSIRAAGGNINLNGTVAEDVVVLGGTVNIQSGGSIGRDLVISGGTVTVAAPVERNVMMTAGTVTLQSKVGGDVSGNVDQLRLDGAAVAGNLDYTSNNEVSLASGAHVDGTTTRHTPASRGAAGAGNCFLGWLRGLIGIFALGVIFLLLLPRVSARAIDNERAQPWASLGIGSVILVVTPIVALIAFIVGIFIGGWWIGLLLVPLWILALALGYVASGFLLGRLIFAQLGWGKYHDILALLGGLVVLTLVGLIPYIGWLPSLAAIVFGSGALALAVTNLMSARTAAAAAPTPAS
jgi:uncharacterized membrane protein YidH (DUF202 family)